MLPPEEQDIEPGEPSSSTGKTRRDTTWRKKDIESVNTTCIIDPLNQNIYGDLTPLEYFHQFVDDDVIRHIVQQTNLYAAI